METVKAILVRGASPEEVDEVSLLALGAGKPKHGMVRNQSTVCTARPLLCREAATASTWQLPKGGPQPSH